MPENRSWSRPGGVCALVLLSALLSAGTLPAQGTLESRFGDIGVRSEPPLTGEHSHGYAEYVVWVRNHSDSKAHRVTLTLPLLPFGDYGIHIRSITRTVEVGPDATVRVSLLQPGQPSLAGQDLGVAIDGSGENNPYPLRILSRRTPYAYYGGSRSSPVVILQSSGIKPTFGAALNRMPGVGGMGGMGGGPGIIMPGMPGGGAGMGGPAGMPGMPVAVPEAEPPGAPPVKMRGGGGPAIVLPALPGLNIHTTPLPATSWTPSWLGHSRYDGVVLTGEELRTMPAAAQMALWQYVECGGALLVVGQAAVPESWRLQSDKHTSLRHYEGGFGTCLVSSSADYDQWPRADWAQVLTSWNETAAPWQKNRSQVDANNDFPVVKDLGVPVVGLFMLLLVFTVIIGPINIVLLSRRRRRIWLLWTVPIISLSTCLAVFGYMVLAEGWRGQRRTETITILDQGSHRAATIGWTSFYSPLTPSGGLHFSPDTELTLQCAPEGGYIYYRRVSSQSCSLSWSADQHLGHGWVTARVPTHFQVRKSSVQRERVTVRRDKEGTVSVVNGLGVAIKSFLYADEKGELYSLDEDIPAGAPAVLKAMHKKVDNPALPENWRKVYRDDWIASFRKMGATGPQLLLPRTYLAQLEGAPFLEEGLANARPQECRSWVLGLLQESGDEG